jgi:hypothetical protein
VLHALRTDAPTTSLPPSFNITIPLWLGYSDTALCVHLCVIQTDVKPSPTKIRKQNRAGSVVEKDRTETIQASANRSA